MGDGSRILSVSKAAAAIFARPVEELLERGSLFDLFETSEQARIRALIADRRARGEPIPEQFETVVVRPDGSLLPVELSIKAVVDGTTTRTYTLISDVGGRQAEQRKLAYQATHDHLTDLPNRFLLLDRLDNLTSQQRRHPSPAMLVFIDLDRFKAVNDRYGHAVGDEVLRTTAQRLAGAMRSCDTVARLGGDEFVVLCTSVGDHGLEDVLAERLRSVVEQPITGDCWEAALGASIGTVTFDDGSVEAELLLARADEAMYASKRGMADPLAR